MDYRPLYAIVVFCIIALACDLAIRSSRTPAKRALAFLLLSTGFWMISLRVLTIPSLPYFSPPVWIVPTIQTLGWIVGSASLWLLANYPLPRTWPRRGVFGLFLLTVGATCVGWWRVGMPLATVTAPYGEHDWRFSLMVGWMLLCLGSTCIYFLLLALRMRGLARLRARHLAVGTGVLGCGIILDLFFRHNPLHLPHPYAGVLVLIAGAVTLTYAVSVTRLGTIKQHIRTALVVTVPFILFFLLVNQYFVHVTEFLTRNIFHSYSQSRLYTSIGFGVLFPLLCVGVRLLTDHLLFTPPYSIPTVLERMNQALGTNRSCVVVAHTVAANLQRLFNPLFITLYVTEQEGHCRRLLHTGAGSPCDVLAVDHPCVRMAREQTIPRVTDEMLGRNPADAFGRPLAEAGISLLVPLHMADHFRGMICLGEKVSGDAYARDDIRLMSTVHNAIALALDNACHYEALTTLNHELEARVLERTHQLEAQAEQLRAADQAKDRFLATVSHELLTPLTAILGWAEIGTLAKTEERREKAFKTIYESGLRQKRLVDDLLDVSRLIYEKFELKVASEDMWQITSSVLADFQAQFHDHQLTVTLDVPDEALPVLVDSTRIHQVLGNLINNAIKFTDPGGTIHIAVQRTTTQCIVVIQDTGKGIAAEELDRIFGIFQQGQQQSYTKGLGLGLALVKGIISLHHGEITVSSPGLGHGSTFTVALPLHLPLENEDSSTVSDQVYA